MIRMMVGLMGSEALTSISSSVMPMMDRRTIARSSWFHLEHRECSSMSGGRGWGRVPWGFRKAEQRRTCAFCF